MGSIPADAIHWDSGDWIEWHRTAAPPENPPCSAPSEDPQARLHTLRTRLLQCARAYFEMSGQHLPVYDSIAKVHAALAFDLPLDQNTCANTDGTPPQLIVIAPHGPTDVVSVDLSKAFCCLIVVRIRDNFKVEGRMMPRATLPDRTEGQIDLHWRDLPTSD
ncbi:hypothetical protein KX928_08660 [Roseobacter sp. YSTF-M11]|uniref:Uncharacterized protein n=1 Tax=Roseobacter insulae TaxID=2859783 RepID=A0A9X1FUY8_9RHOB|nr:hypothetical protein [Roseobacter insulae]MBW4707854.1 hypothetical protein [Roseobacter insulae]